MISPLASLRGIEGEEKMSDEERDEMINQVRDVVESLYKYTSPLLLRNRKVIKRELP